MAELFLIGHNSEILVTKWWSLQKWWLMVEYCILLTEMPKMPFQDFAHPTKQLFFHLAFPLHWQISCLSGLRGEDRARMFTGSLWRNMQKVFPLIYVNFCTSKLWAWKQVISWAPEITKLVCLRMCVLWLGSSSCSNTQILTGAFPKVEGCNNALSDAHPPESKKLEPTLQLFIYSTEVL